jgi:transposase
MNDWPTYTHFAGLDWASDHHDVVVVDARGAIVARFRFSHNAEGWTQCRERLAGFGALPVAIETSQGAAVQQLLALGAVVYPVHPKSAERYRDRKAPSGVKDDALDAWSLADALRVDGHGWRQLLPEDPLLEELRLLTRDECALIEQRTALINQLQKAVGEYFPSALEAFSDWTQLPAWRFILSFPTPAALHKAGKRKWEKWLHAQRLWRPQTLEARLAFFDRATEFTGSAAQIAAKSLLAQSCARLLCTLQEQLAEYRRRIEQLFDQHPDSGLFGSLPGAGAKLGPRLLSEIGTQRLRFSSAEALQAYAGTAPITFQSGQIRKTLLRRSCSHTLRAAVHLWANLSRAKCAWAQAYYAAHRQKGQSHACALRCLGQRWLKILWKMWQSRTRYDEALHARNQIKHGSWLLQLSTS